MIEGTLDGIGPDGIARGWMMDTEATAPPVVHLRLGGTLVAETVAMSFRADLLAAGKLHGHWGFAARLRQAVPPGPAAADLVVPARAQGLRLRTMVPPLAAQAPASVEALLARPAAWTAADLLSHPAALGLPACLAAMGPARFVEVTYRFALARWPSEAERQVDAAALQSGQLTPEALLVELLGSREHVELAARDGPALPSPWDAAFPYSGPLARIPAA